MTLPFRALITIFYILYITRFMFEKKINHREENEPKLYFFKGFNHMQDPLLT